MKPPTGYALSWSGQYENMLRVKEQLKLILPITLVLELLVYPAIYFLWRRKEVVEGPATNLLPMV
jgi:Cu/Ag efflux pump CusA